MLNPRWLTLVCAVLISWTGYGQKQIERPIADIVKEGTGKLGQEIAEFEALRKMGADAAKELGDRLSGRSALRQTREYIDYVREGKGTSTHTSFEALVDQAFDKIKANPKPGQGMIYSELEAANDARWFWQKQKLNQQGELLEVKPALFESGDVSVSMPLLRSFYESAIQRHLLDKKLVRDLKLHPK